MIQAKQDTSFGVGASSGGLRVAAEMCVEAKPVILAFPA